MNRFATYAFMALLGTGVEGARADSGFVHSSPALTLARPCDPDASCAFSWTVASRMGHILRFVEKRYGPRDRDWTLLGVEFTVRETPQVWYPTFDGIGDTIIIQLSRSAATNERQALFQLAHEVVHLLSPAGPGARASVLEEGLATHASLEYLAAIDRPVTPGYIDAPRYERAYRLVAALARRPDFATGIRALRARHGRLSGLNAIDLQRAWPGLEGAEARALAAGF